MRNYLLYIGVSLFVMGISQTINLGALISARQQLSLFLIIAGAILIGYWIGLYEGINEV